MANWYDNIPGVKGIIDIASGRDVNHDASAGNADQLSRSGPNQAAYQNPALAGLQTTATALGSAANNHSMNYGAAQPGQNAQNDALGLSGQLARGQGPSLSRANMNLGLSQGANNLMSAQAGFGAQGGLGQRNMMNAMAGMQGQAAGQGAVAGAQEQIGNIQNYGALGSAARGQGLQQSGMDAMNAHQNRADQLNSLGLAGNLSQQGTQNAMQYDAQRTGHAQDVYNARQGNVVADNSSNNKWLERGGNAIKAGASAMANLPTG